MIIRREQRDFVSFMSNAKQRENRPIRVKNACIPYIVCFSPLYINSFLLDLLPLLPRSPAPPAHLNAYISLFRVAPLLGLESLGKKKLLQRSYMMSNDDSVAKNSSSVPFFARYLEGQFLTEVSEEEMDEVKGGIRFTRPPLEDIAYSLKYPSDNEDGNPGHQIVTKKYPSDIEDIGSGGHPMTKKYPSDADEAVTHKYPSDGDDDFSFDF